jgi:hypothetical protein
MIQVQTNNFKNGGCLEDIGAAFSFFKRNNEDFAGQNGRFEDV